MSELVCIVNPRSAGGRTARAWPHMAASLAAAGLNASVRHTEGPGDATRLAREALSAGALTVVAVGGDGTIHEVANGFFADGAAPPAGARLGILPAGSGSDLIKTLGIPADEAGAIAVLARGSTRTLDVGRVTYQAHDGSTRVRHFLNTCSLGASGATVEAMRALPDWLAGTPAYVLGTLQTLVTFKPFPLRLELDGEALPECRAIVVVVGNGQYFGSGMRIVPEARPDDGWLDVLVIKEATVPELLWNFPKVFSGQLSSIPQAITGRARRVAITGGVPQPLEVDGEQPGHTPATIELLPAAIRVLV